MRELFPERDDGVVGAHIHNVEHGIAGEIPFNSRSLSTGLIDCGSWSATKVVRIR